MCYNWLIVAEVNDAEIAKFFREEQLAAERVAAFDLTLFRLQMFLEDHGEAFLPTAPAEVTTPAEDAGTFVRRVDLAVFAREIELGRKLTDEEFEEALQVYKNECADEIKRLGVSAGNSRDIIYLACSIINWHDLVELGDTVAGPEIKNSLRAEFEIRQKSRAWFELLDIEIPDEITR